MIHLNISRSDTQNYEVILCDTEAAQKNTAFFVAEVTNLR